MTSGKYFVCLLLMLLAAPECFAKHRKHTDKPLNENQPTMFATSPPLEMPMYEEDSGPALIAADPMASKYPFYQEGIRRHPKLFLDTLPQTNLPKYMARGMQLDSNVYKIVTMTPNGFKDYATLVSRKYLDIDEKVKKEKGRKNGQ